MGLFDSPTHLLIILVVLVVLFGSAKLPKAAKSMGEAMRIFKKESAKMHEEDSVYGRGPGVGPAAGRRSAAAGGPAAGGPPQATQEQMAALQQQMDALQQQMAAPQPTVAQPAPVPRPARRCRRRSTPTSPADHRA